MFQELERNILDYRFMLEEEYRRRREKNDAYSLRAYAKCLGVSVPYLSQLLSKKRNLSAPTATKFVSNLNWSKSKGQLFIDLIQLNSLPEGESREYYSKQIRKKLDPSFHEVSKDQFQLVSEWQHFAIVELVGLSGFEATVKNLAKRLKLSRKVIQESVDRLLRVGLLVQASGTLKKSTSYYRIQSIPSSAIRLFHYHHMKAAIKALDTQPQDVRDITGTTLAIDKKSIPEVKKLIREFRDQLNSYCTTNGNADSVYQLAIQFFRLDTDEVAT